MTASPPAPYHLRPTRTADHHAYHGRANDDARLAWLRKLGYTTTRDWPSGGVWFARDGLCSWAVSPAVAVRAVENGWPHIPEVVPA